MGENRPRLGFGLNKICVDSIHMHWHAVPAMPLLTSSLPVFPALSDWHSKVGNFLLSFGHLEYSIFLFLEIHLLPGEFAKVRELPMKNRLKRVADIIKAKDYPTNQQIAFARFFERLDPIRELRNHIAHGFMQITIDENRPRVTVIHGKDFDSAHLSDSKHVDFDQLVASLTTLVELIEEFQHLTGWATHEFYVDITRSNQ